MFTTYFVQPIYNAFVFLIGVVPGGDVGLAIVALTLLMRIVLYPVFASSIRTQMGMQAMQGELDEINAKYKDKPEALAQARIDLLKRHKVNPLAGIAALVIQLVLLISLYLAMFREGFPAIRADLLYSFVHAPATIDTQFLGFLNLLTPHHILLAALVGLTQYVTIHMTLSRTTKGQTHQSKEKAAAARMQNSLMLYVMPAMLAVFGYIFPAAVGLYFLTGNMVSVGQEWLIRRQLARRHEQP